LGGTPGFLHFQRIQKAGKDGRFDELKPSFIRFLNVWTIQGLWVTFTASAALVAISSTNRKELDLFAIIGFLVWLIGFAIEVAADTQKRHFSADLNNKGKFIQTGKRDFGHAPVTPITSERSYSGSESRSLPCPFYKAGNGLL
jgi:steroid 5-alpha reductase family enzyme